jgi:hypothetical protein
MYLQSILASALVGAVKYMSWPLYPCKITPFRINMSFIDSTAGVDLLEKRKAACLCRDINPGSSSPKHGHCPDYDIPTLETNDDM